ncbi:hypothetical protein [Paractinoplanes globisporus]|uniref:Uncharacterized protein n=1 Tax=Paractinoplanes globisporus TaxID=113565 RepID=A0ABW6WDG6_9ACTN|nr:hypothetical protein [Actinoplanes globisporus]
MDERELRDRLETATVPPSRLEVGTLVADGRRRVTRRRTWRAAGGAALAVAVLVTVPVLLGRPHKPSVVVDNAPSSPSSNPPSAKPTPSQSSAPVACAIKALPVPAGLRDVTVSGVDPTGRYIVGNATRGDFKPVLWADGKAHALPMLEASMELDNVNSGGIVVGLAGVADKTVFRYQNGKYTRLRTPAGNWHAYPEPVINTAGDIVVNVEPSGNTGGKDSIVLFWPAGQTSARKLPLPAGANVMAILDDGTLVGALYVDGVAIAGYSWDQQGHGRKLPTPAGQNGAAYAARGDWATGGFWPNQTAALWNLRTGEMREIRAPKDADLPPAMADLGPGEQVNDDGWVVAGGYAMRDGDPAKLTVPAHQRASAVAISDDGLVVGNAQSSAGELVGPRTWRC